MWSFPYASVTHFLQNVKKKKKKKKEEENHRKKGKAKEMSSCVLLNISFQVGSQTQNLF
jgi:hypothetical protein